MLVLTDKPTSFFDVDDTLLMWDVGEDTTDYVEITCDGYVQCLRPHTEHVEQIKKLKSRGHHIVIWSQGGAAWAHSAIKALKLEKYVDVVMNKPSWVYDDMSLLHWMPDPIYLKREDYLDR